MFLNKNEIDALLTKEQAEAWGIEPMPPEMAGAEVQAYRARPETPPPALLDDTMKKRAWDAGYRAGRRGEADEPPAAVRDHYSWRRGYIEGRRKAGNYPVLIPLQSWTKH